MHPHKGNMVPNGTRPPIWRRNTAPNLNWGCELRDPAPTRSDSQSSREHVPRRVSCGTVIRTGADPICRDQM